MAWDFSTEPEFQQKLDWIKQFCEEKVEPLHHVFPHAVRLPDPAVKAYVKANLANYKVPRSVHFLDELPRNPTGKILKRDLRKPYWADRERQVN